MTASATENTATHSPLPENPADLVPAPPASMPVSAPPSVQIRNVNASTEVKNLPLFDVAIVLPTTLEKSIFRAARSVYRQDFNKRIQLLIGIDAIGKDRLLIESLKAECPSHIHLTIIDLGYSTSTRHGGFYSVAKSGAMRTILSYLAHSRLIAYLEEDSWFETDHISTLYQAIQGADFAYSMRNARDPLIHRVIEPDRTYSIGKVRHWISGILSESYIAASCLMIDTMRCIDVLPLWSEAFFEGAGEERIVSGWLMDNRKGVAVANVTSNWIAPLDFVNDLIGQRHNTNKEPWPWESVLKNSNDRKNRLLEAVTRLPFPKITPGKADSSAPAAPAKPLFEIVINQLKPETILQVGAGKGHDALHIAALCKGLGLEPVIVCVDTWLGTLADLISPDQPAEGFVENGYPRLFEIFAKQIGGSQYHSSIYPFLQETRIAARYFEERHILVDMVHISGEDSEEGIYQDLNDYWPFVRPGGLILGGCYDQQHPDTVRGANRFTRETRANFQVGGEDHNRMYLIQKPTDG